MRRAEAAGRARGPGRAGERGELAVGDDLAPRHLAQRARAPLEERRLVLEVERNVGERDRAPREVPSQPPNEFRHEVSTSRCVFAPHTFL